MPNQTAMFILFLMTGLTLFLFGTMKLTTSVQELLTARIRDYIKYTVKKPFYALLTGIATTILFQSSSASTVLTVGMVSAGLITFYHSLGVLLGADIGTTLTVQLVVWKFTDLSPFVLIAGGALWLLGSRRWKLRGEAVFYFGLIFFGLNLTVLATAPLKADPDFIRFLSQKVTPFFGIGIGLIVTALIHSSAIPISIMAILAQSGLVTLENALPIIIGANVGTAATALMAGAAADVSGKRTAVSHFLFKLGGMVVCLIALAPFTSVVKSAFSDTAQQIAFGHFLFNVLTVLIFIFFLKPFSRFIERIIPGDVARLPLWPEYLDEKYLNDPEAALDQVGKELEREMMLSRRMFSLSLELMEDYQEVKKKNIRYIEPALDRLREEIVRYLWKISCNVLKPAASNRLFAYTALVDDIRRIGRHANHIADLAKDKHESGIEFSEPGKAEIQEINRLTAANVRDAADLIQHLDIAKIQDVTIREEIIDEQVKEAREKHLVRFRERVCQAQAGPIFVELLIHLERISDHCQNIAEYVIDLKA